MILNHIQNEHELNHQSDSEWISGADCINKFINQEYLTGQEQKSPSGTAIPLRDSVKHLRGNYIMKTVKKEWEPRIVNIMADGSIVEDLTGYVIPAGHSYYDIILGMNKRELQKGA